MSYPHHTSTTDPYVSFSLWPDASASGEEEMAVCARAAGYAEPELISDNFAFGVLDATAAWGQSATLPAATYGFQNSYFDTDWASGGMAPVEGVLERGVSLADATATDTVTFAPVPSLPFPTDRMGFTQDCFSSHFDYSDLLSGTPSPTESSVPSPQSYNTGDGFIPIPAYFVQPSGPSSSQLNIDGDLLPNQFTYAPPPLFMGDTNLAGNVSPDHGPKIDFMGLNSNMYPTQSEYIRSFDHITAPTEALTVTVTDATMPSSLGKRSRGRYETYSYGLQHADDEVSEEDESGPQKRARPTATRVPGGAQSANRTRRSPATRTRKNINNKSKAAGRGAERLAFTTAQGVYHRPFPGLSVSQGSVGVLEQGQSSWIEERDVEVETLHGAGSSAPRQIVLPSAENAEGGDLHEIPGNLSARQRLMLQTSEEDEERGAVRNIKCKLCPAARFGKWETYKRHCKSCEKHPSELRFCPRCGDYFGRPDSGIRHHKDKKYQEACISTSQDDAREKKQKVERLLKGFESRLEHCLKNGKEIGPRFSDIVNNKLTNTSKKVSKQKEIGLEGDSWAAGLC